MSTTFKQGLYTVKNPHKYVGDINKVRYMSSWELKCHQYFDLNERVIKWGSEVLAIPYFNPIKKKICRYYPDYCIQYINPNNEVISEILEVKPASQCKAPRKNRKHNLYESAQFAVNQAKFAAAEQYCREHGLVFKILTEHSIFR